MTDSKRKPGDVAAVGETGPEPGRIVTAQDQRGIEAAARQERRAKALRENLHRRKAQSRGRGGDPANGPGK